ncbi:hypothetical protein CHU98_g4543 [Xylaria longipes]|nr:hypothetical protein CHU98_g4543 [Xylaria longipes]
MSGSGKLDQPLDEIISTQRRAVGGRRKSQRRSAGRPVATAPIGGVQKTARLPRNATAKQAPAKAAGGNGESKVVVSNLPKDVNETQIKSPSLTMQAYSFGAATVSEVEQVFAMRLYMVKMPPRDYTKTMTQFVFSLAEQQHSWRDNLQNEVGCTELDLWDYFSSSVGPIKRVEVSYGPNSVSRGIATVTFHKPDGASKAFNVLNGILVDGRPMKIEIVVSAAKAAEIIPTTKTLTERITQPKAQPKSAANDKKKDAGKAVGSGARGRKRRPVRSSRPAKKTAEELDSEMADYFNSGDQNENANGAVASTSADAAMDDEISEMVTFGLLRVSTRLQRRISAILAY